MTYFNTDPASDYRNIEAKIPFIKDKNKNFMNKLHNLNMSADYWWALTGEYAILAEYAIMLSDNDPRLLNDLNNISGKKLEVSDSCCSDCNDNLVLPTRQTSTNDRKDLN